MPGERVGFTLTELVVAGAIAVVVLGLVVTAGTGLRRADDHEDDRHTFHDVCARLTAHVRRDLRSAVDVDCTSPGIWRITVLQSTVDGGTTYRDVVYRIAGEVSIERVDGAAVTVFDVGPPPPGHTFSFAMGADGSFVAGETPERVTCSNVDAITRTDGGMWHHTVPCPAPLVGH